MAHRPILARSAKPRRSEDRIKIRHREEITKGHRGHTMIWLPSGHHERIVTATGTTGALSPGFAGSSAHTGPDVIGVIVMIGLNANTNTSGQVRAMVFRDRDGSANTDAAVHASQEMGNNTWTTKTTGIAPMIDNGVYWQTQISGTVNYDFFLDIIGWVLG